MAGPLTPTQLAEELRALADPKGWERELRKTYRKVGTKAAGFARAEMRSGGDRQLAAAARAVRGASTLTAATLAVTASKSVPFALVAVYGKAGRTGWNEYSYSAAGVRLGPRAYRNGKRQHPAWITNQWTVATPGQGPRGINTALSVHLPELVEDFAVASSDFIGRALPGS